MSAVVGMCAVSQDHSACPCHASTSSAGATVYAADIISAVTFDHTGQHLATGDRGGRVVLFERVPTQPVRFDKPVTEPALQRRM